MRWTLSGPFCDYPLWEKMSFKCQFYSQCLFKYSMLLNYMERILMRSERTTDRVTFWYSRKYFLSQTKLPLHWQHYIYARHPARPSGADCLRLSLMSLLVSVPGGWEAPPAQSPHGARWEGQTMSSNLILYVQNWLFNTIITQHHEGVKLMYILKFLEGWRSM